MQIDNCCDSIEIENQSEDLPMQISKVGGIIAVVSKTNAQSFSQNGIISIIRRIVITYQQAGIFPIVIITDAEDGSLKLQLANYGVIFLQNAEPCNSSELFTFIKTGLKYLEGKCNQVMFTPLSCPMFTATTLLTLMERSEDIVIASHQRHGGHPVLISQSAIPSILKYQGENGLRGAIASSELQRVWVDVNDKGVLLRVHDGEDLNLQLNENNSVVLHPVLQLRLEREESFFNERLKTLLFLILNHYSIHKGCACIGLAYSKAWAMIKQLESNLGYPVITRHRGGKGGGGAFLTPEGERFLTAYQQFEESVHQTALKEFRKHFIDSNII